MPYAAICDDKIVYSYDLDTREFDELRGCSLSCPECGGRLIPRKYSNQHIARHFYHQNTDHCAFDNVSAEHLELQRIIERVVNGIDGWEAHAEYRGNNWRGDVVAINRLTLKKYSFEVQLSNMTAEEAADREFRHKADGVNEVIWICGQNFPWARKVASCRFNVDSWNKKSDPVILFNVLTTNARTRTTRFERSRALARLIEAILSGKAVPVYEDKIVIMDNSNIKLFDYNGVIFESAEDAASRKNAKEVGVLLDRKRRRQEFRTQSIGSRKIARRSIAKKCEAELVGLIFNEGGHEIAYAMHTFLDGTLIVVDPSVSGITKQRYSELFEHSTLIIMSNRDDVERMISLPGMMATVKHSSWLAVAGTLSNFIAAKKPSYMELN